MPECPEPTTVRPATGITRRHMATTTSYSLEVLVVALDLSTFKLRQDWVSIRSTSFVEDLLTLAATVSVPDGVLRIKKTVSTSDLTIEYIELPVDIP